MTGIELIAKERQEQISKHGRTVDMDVATNESGQLLQAADQLILQEITPCHEEDGSCPEGWDENIWSKIFNKPTVERLAIAGALIAAEIDRLQVVEQLNGANATEAV